MESSSSSSSLGDSFFVILSGWGVGLDGGWVVFGAVAGAGEGSSPRSRRDLRRAASVSSRVGSFLRSMRSTLILR
jgi:hypothetical protein